MKSFAGLEDPLLDSQGRRSDEEKLDHRRGVDDDHRPSRSARTALAGDSLGTTGLRRCRCSRISSNVGLSALRSISESR